MFIMLTLFGYAICQVTLTFDPATSVVLKLPGIPESTKNLLQHKLWIWYSSVVVNLSEPTKKAEPTGNIPSHEPCYVHCKEIMAQYASYLNIVNALYQDVCKNFIGVNNENNLKVIN